MKKTTELTVFMVEERVIYIVSKGNRLAYDTRRWSKRYYHRLLPKLGQNPVKHDKSLS